MKKYMTPEIEIKVFATEDIITASSKSMDTHSEISTAADVDSATIGITIPYGNLK